jgi:CheY-like chemotaxis protein/nitrogen-specific signal transduction histidine kinase
MLKEQHQANYQLERLNQMLQWARRHAEEARADRDRFILAVSHELRSPLNFIIGFSDLMVNTPEMYAEQANWPPGLYDDIQEIYRSSTHLLRLINDILDMGQIDAQQMTIFREWLSLETLAEEVRKMVEPAYTQKGLQLNITAESDLPDVFADSTRLRQVLLNLLNNSLRFTDRGSVTIHLGRTQDKLQICIEDTGSGISPEEAAKVFDEFRQVGQESWRRREGSGLGLAISRRFIQLHGGSMWLESVPGAGSRFYFTIPILQAAASDDEAASPPNLQPQSSAGVYYPTQASRPTCGLLTTNPAAEQAVQQCLDDYQVFSLEQAELLPERLNQLLPRAILVDKSSQDEQRLSLKDLPYDLPILAFYIPGIWERFETLPAGIADYLVKPIARQTLVSAVQQLGEDIQSLLVVDDDPAMLRFVTQALRSTRGPGLPAIEHIHGASSGEEALRLLHETPIDAILLDIDLPDTSGWRVLAALQRIPDLAAIPVVIISATDLPRIFFAGGRTVLNVSMKRPFSPQELSAALRALLENVEPGLSRAADLTAPAQPTSPAG